MGEWTAMASGKLLDASPRPSVLFAHGCSLTSADRPQFVGLTTSAVLFIGYDGAAHMAEEVKNAAVNVPRSMFFTIFVNGALGFGSIIALLYSIGDVDAALSSPTGWPFIEIFYQATQSKGGATAMTSVLIVLIVCATFGYVASASRQLWAFARDRGVPGWQLISKVCEILHCTTARLTVAGRRTFCHSIVRYWRHSRL